MLIIDTKEQLEKAKKRKSRGIYNYRIVSTNTIQNKKNI